MVALPLRKELTNQDIECVKIINPAGEILEVVEPLEPLEFIASFNYFWQGEQEAVPVVSSEFLDSSCHGPA